MKNAKDQQAGKQGSRKQREQQVANGGSWFVRLRNARGLIEDDVRLPGEVGEQLKSLVFGPEAEATQKLTAMIRKQAAVERGEATDARFQPLPPVRGVMQFALETGGFQGGKSCGEDAVLRELWELSERLKHVFQSDELLGLSLRLNSLFELLRLHPSFQRHADAIRMSLEGPRLLEALLMGRDEMKKRFGDRAAKVAP